MMNKIVSSAVLFAALSGLSACGHAPKHTLSRGNVASSVRLIDAPIGAILQSGNIAVRVDRKGEARLTLKDGWHDVLVFIGEQQIHSERVFLQDGTQKTIDLEP